MKLKILTILRVKFIVYLLKSKKNLRCDFNRGYFFKNTVEKLQLTLRVRGRVKTF